MTELPDGNAPDEWTPVSPEFPEHWSQVSFEDVFSVVSTTDKKIPQKQYLAKGMWPVIDQGASYIGGYTDDETKIIYVDEPLLVFGDHTRCFKFVRNHFAPGADGTKILAVSPQLSPEFYYYLYFAIKLPDRGYSRHFGFLKRCLFPIAPLNEQRRIVEKIEALFDEIDKGVESLKTAKTALGLYRQSLLKFAFEGRLTADWRARNADKLEAPETLLARIQAERETRYKAALDAWQDALAKWRAGGEKGKKPAKPKQPERHGKLDFSDPRELPDGWAYLPFESLAWSIRNGISAKPDEKGPLKIFRISAVRPMAFDLEDFRRITDLNGSYADYRLVHGDLVFTRYNGSRDYVGVSAMYRGDGTHVYPDKLIRCEIKSDILNSAFLEAATNCGESRAYIERRIRTTAGQSGISGGDIKAMPVPICPPAEQAEIVRLLDARLDAADALGAEIDAALSRAEVLRQSILKKAFSGRLVPQEPTDEPATALLERIKAGRAKAPKTGRMRVQA